MTTRSADLARLVAAALVAGCGNSTPRSDTAFEFCMSRDNAMLGWEARCANYSAAFIASLRGQSATACNAEAREVAVGRATYDRAKGSSCLTALGTEDCAEFFTAVASGTSACARVYTGTVASGGTCYSALDCAAGYCDLGSCTGTCSPFANQGESCLHQACAPGFACMSATEGALTAPACQPVSGEGGPCPCDVNFFCDTSGDSPRCRAARKAGTSCTTTAQCGVPLECGGTPVECRLPGRAGANCGAAGVTCAYGLYCDPARSVCAESPTVGQQCVIEVSGHPVQLVCTNAWCDVLFHPVTGAVISGTQRCMPRLPDGEVCQYCQPVQPAGEACGGRGCQGYCDATGLCASTPLCSIP